MARSKIKAALVSEASEKANLSKFKTRLVNG